MFSDELTFQLVNSREATVRRPSTISWYLQKYIIPMVKHSASVMIWGCFSGTWGKGGLYFLPKNQTMNRQRYLTVLENHLLPFMRIHSRKWFLQDGTPCHKSEVVMSNLKEMEEEFKVLDWLGNSPDLHPVENCWAYMKAQLKKFQGVTSLPRMIEAIKMMWVRDLSQAYFKKLSASMPQLIKQVIANNGHMTKYKCGSYVKSSP
jgi:hypothetical protein